MENREEQIKTFWAEGTARADTQRLQDVRAQHFFGSGSDLLAFNLLGFVIWTAVYEENLTDT